MHFLEKQVNRFLKLKKRVLTETRFFDESLTVITTNMYTMTFIVMMLVRHCYKINYYYIYNLEEYKFSFAATMVWHWIISIFFSISPIQAIFQNIDLNSSEIYHPQFGVRIVYPDLSDDVYLVDFVNDYDGFLCSFVERETFNFTKGMKGMTDK